MPVVEELPAEAEVPSEQQGVAVDL
jgi:hypothetical protein